MALPKPTSSGRSDGALSEAARYWDQIDDPQNLERETGEEARVTLDDEIAFAQTPDLAAAARWMTGAPRRPTWIMDLGAGLGANSFALIQREELPVVAVDTSLNRLRLLRRRAEQAGVADRIGLIVACAEQLPFAEGSVPAIYTHSVLIHTELSRSASEIARTLAPRGRAALVEPQPAHPLAALYRRMLAPKAWQSITRYFDPAAQAVYLQALPAEPDRQPVRPFFLLSFLAFLFEFGWPRLGLFRRSLAVLHPIDCWLLRVFPGLSRWAWFGLIELEKPDTPNANKS